MNLYIKERVQWSRAVWFKMNLILFSQMDNYNEILETTLPWEDVMVKVAI